MTPSDFGKMIGILEAGTRTKFKVEEKQFFWESMETFIGKACIQAAHVWVRTNSHLPKLAELLTTLDQLGDFEAETTGLNFLNSDDLDFNGKCERLYNIAMAIPDYNQRVKWAESLSPRQLWFLQEAKKLCEGWKLPEYRPYGTHGFPLYHRKNLRKFRNYKEAAKCCAECRAEIEAPKPQPAEAR